MELDEPVQAFQLIWVHLTVLRQTLGLMIETNDGPFGLRRLQELRVFFFLSHPALLSAGASLLLALCGLRGDGSCGQPIVSEVLISCKASTK